MNKKIIQKCTLLRRTFVLITLLVSFLVFSKASAVSYNVNLAPTGRYEPANNGIMCVTVDNIVKGGSEKNSCNYNSINYIDKSILYYRTINKLNVKSDMFYIQDFYTFTQYNSNFIYRDTQAFPGWKVIDLSQDWTSNLTEYCKRYEPTNNAISPTTYYCNNFALADLSTDDYQIQKWTLILQPTQDDNIWYGYGNYNQTSPIFSMPVGGIMVFGDVKEYRIVGDEISEAEAKTEDATNEGEQNADSASSDNEAASQNMLQVAGGIVSAFSSPATNCSISGDLGNVNLGTLNFCTDKPTAIISAMDAIATCIVAFMVFRIIKRLIGRFTALSAYGQGGSE